MTPEEHKKQHQLLHKMLDELLADWITNGKKSPLKATILELITWSNEQTENPTQKGE